MMPSLLSSIRPEYYGVALGTIVWAYWSFRNLYNPVKLAFVSMILKAFPSALFMFLLNGYLAYCLHKYLVGFLREDLWLITHPVGKFIFAAIVAQFPCNFILKLRQYVPTREPYDRSILEQQVSPEQIAASAVDGATQSSINRVSRVIVWIYRFAFTKFQDVATVEEIKYTGKIARIISDRNRRNVKKKQRAKKIIRAINLSFESARHEVAAKIRVNLFRLPEMGTSYIPISDGVKNSYKIFICNFWDNKKIDFKDYKVKLHAAVLYYGKKRLDKYFTTPASIPPTFKDQNTKWNGDENRTNGASTRRTKGKGERVYEVIHGMVLSSKNTNLKDELSALDSN